MVDGLTGLGGVGGDGFDYARTDCAGQYYGIRHGCSMATVS